MKQSLAFSDKEVAILLNVVQLYIIMSGKHPAVDTVGKQLQHMALAKDALESFNDIEFHDVHSTLLAATTSFEDPDLRQVHAYRPDRN